jgi:predicted ATPase
VVARALELPVASGDHQLSALVAGLKPLDVLLVLDNAEHLIDEVARLCAAIMTGAPGVRLLITSQVVLKVERERVFRLGPLAIPEPGTSAQTPWSTAPSDCSSIRRRRRIHGSGSPTRTSAA